MTRDALMDIAQEALVNGRSEQDVVTQLQPLTSDAAAIVRATATHPITKILVARNA